MVGTLTLPNFYYCVLRVALRCYKHRDLVGRTTAFNASPPNNNYINRRPLRAQPASTLG